MNNNFISIEMFDIPIGVPFEFNGQIFEMIPYSNIHMCGPCEFTKNHKGCSKVCCSKYARRDKKNVIVINYKKSK